MTADLREVRLCRARLQAATEAARYSEQQQASAIAAGQEAQHAAAQVAATHKAASKAKAEADKLAARVSRLQEAGRLEEAKKAQTQAKRSAPVVAHCVYVEQHVGVDLFQPTFMVVSVHMHRALVLW